MLIRININRFYSGRVGIAAEHMIVKMYRKTPAYRDLCKKKPDTRFDTHCIKTGVQLWCGQQDSIARLPLANGKEAASF